MDDKHEGIQLGYPKLVPGFGSVLIVMNEREERFANGIGLFAAIVFGLGIPAALLFGMWVMGDLAMVWAKL